MKEESRAMTPDRLSEEAPGDWLCFQSTPWSLPLSTMAESSSDSTLDPTYRAAVVDLLAVLAYGELSAFQRLAADSAMAPTIEDAAALAAMATAEHRHFMRLRDRLIEWGADPEEAIRPFVAAIDGFHRHTAPSDWLESLVKAYVGDGIGTDFYREISAYLEPDDRELVTEVCEDLGQSAFVVEKVRAAIADDPSVAGRLALWGRRLVGEALSQAQRVAAERDSLTDFLMAGSGTVADLDLMKLGEMFGRLTTNHTRRMESLGLAA